VIIWQPHLHRERQSFIAQLPFDVAGFANGELGLLHRSARGSPLATTGAELNPEQETLGAFRR
jgi:hypothetical protein